jgi:pimeloyl-ACP methyl ester carboxylesterase
MKRVLVLLILCMTSRTEFAEDSLRQYLESQVRYWGIARTVTPEDMDHLVDLKRLADSPGLAQEERTKAYSDLFHFTQKLRGIPEGRVPASLAAAYWSPGQSSIPPAYGSAKPGRFPDVQKTGSGKIPVILIPDIGVDASVFESFILRNKTRYHFYSVTLPGFGESNPPARNTTLNFEKLSWWNNAMTALINLIQQEHIDRPFVLGHQAGSYLAMRIALEHPDRIRGAIVLNGLLFATFPGMPERATIEERVRYVNSLTPIELFPIPSSESFFRVMMQSCSWYCKKKERQEFIIRLMSRQKPWVWWNYFAELATTDLSVQMKTLKAPMLVLPSIYDKESAGYQQSKVTMDQWDPLDHANSNLPIAVVRMEDCRSYATEDQPAKLDESIQRWIAALQK